MSFEGIFTYHARTFSKNSFNTNAHFELPQPYICNLKILRPNLKIPDTFDYVIKICDEGTRKY